MIILPLFLNDIGGSEILLIMMVVLMFFGSKSIPGIAKTLGRTLYEFRNATSELQNEIKKSGFDIKNDLKIENILKENTEPILQPLDQVFTDIENTVHYGANSKVETNISTVIDDKDTENQLINTLSSTESNEPEIIQNQLNTEKIEKPNSTKTNEL